MLFHLGIIWVTYCAPVSLRYCKGVCRKYNYKQSQKISYKKQVFKLVFWVISARWIYVFFSLNMAADLRDANSFKARTSNYYWIFISLQGSYTCDCSPGYVRDGDVCFPVQVDQCNATCSGLHSVCLAGGECECTAGEWSLLSDTLQVSWSALYRLSCSCYMHLITIYMQNTRGFLFFTTYYRCITHAKKVENPSWYFYLVYRFTTLRSCFCSGAFKTKFQPII